MKTAIPASLILLVLFGSSTLANPVPDTAIPDSAPHNAQGAATDNPGTTVTDEQKQAAAKSQKCITFTSDNPNWHYANTGVWGSATGTFGSGSKKICVPYNDGPGGAMFIGTTANPQGGNTKLECKFPSAGTANCDMSLVDGYSLSVTCKAGGKTIGGGLDLWKTGAKCVDTSLENQGMCKNDKGYAPNQGDVTQFFQKAIQNGNQYCIWVNCKQDYYFPVTADVTCHVNGGR